ncbi:MAG: contact-dependent growth inhibition system immunity protein [Pseudomonadota bacterium]
MGQSSANLLEFLATVFSADMDVWSASSTDEEAIRAIARDFPPRAQQTLLNELDALLDGGARDAVLLALAHDARVNYLLEESTVREWFRMIREQVRLVVAAS